MSDFWVMKKPNGALLQDTAKLKKSDCVAEFMSKPSIRKIDNKDFGFWRSKGFAPVRALLVEIPSNDLL